MERHFCRRPYQGNQEALGWALDGIARIVGFIAAAVFLSTAIINLAKKQAGCVTEIPEGEVKAPECDAKVYGIKPSSLLTTYGTIVGLISAFCLPVVGAIVDYTPHRKWVGLISSIFQIAFIFSQIFINESNWFLMTILQVFSAFTGWIHTLVAFAYLPELTEDANLLVSWTANFHMLQYISLVLFLLYMLGVLYATGYNGNDILSTRVASISSLIIVSPCYLWTWTMLMKHRDAFHQLTENSLWTVGFIKVYRTSKMLGMRFRALFWFFVNVALVEAAQQSIATISLTYMTDTLQMTSSENGIAILLLFLFGILGTIIGKTSVKCINPIHSNQICQVMTGLNTGMAALILWGPGQQIRAYIVASIWGIGAGWKNTVERYTVTQIIPKGQDTELMGFYLFASQVLVWMPTLFFTIMNEHGVQQRVSILVLIAFFLGGLLSLWMMGSYDEAVRLAREGENDNQQVMACEVDSADAEGSNEKQIADCAKDDGVHVKN
jgi:MFS-type transporter involved in bile tolerance (Atg22 family)